MDWEKSAIEAMQPFGALLEIGFSSLAANAMQKCHPESHTILAPLPKIAEEAQKWAKKHPSVQVVEGPLSSLGLYDSIFCHSIRRSVAIPLLEEGETLLREIEEELPHLVKMRYTESELIGLCEAAASAPKAHLSRFLAELEENGQIDPELRKKIAKKYHLPAPKKETNTFESCLLETVVECLERHMRKGSRFCTSSTLLDEMGYIDKIVANPQYDVRADLACVVIEKIHLQ